ncbi:MAG: dockerin type I domain-containing protein [Planctomycetota bacterium]
MQHHEGPVRLRPRVLLAFAAVALCGGLAQSSAQDVLINEIFYDPPSGFGQEGEYIELRGVPGLSLEDHYLIFLESELNEGPGGIDNIFDLGGFTLSDTGYLTLRQQGSPFTPLPTSNNFINEGPLLPPFGNSPGFGSGAASTIGHSDDGGDGRTENAAFSAFLIRNDTGEAPTLSDDLDANNDGVLDVATGAPGWTILDSIGASEPGENNVQFYAAINFQDAGSTGATAQPGGVIVSLPYEIEYLGRWGNSTGSTAADWHVSNLTIDNRSGYQNEGDYRQAGDHPPDDNNDNTPAPQPAIVETNQGVPYGTILTDSLGGPNYITGDYNDDGFVDGADYAAWRNSLGAVGDEENHPPADNNHDFVVDGLDLALWQTNFGGPLSGASFAAPQQSGAVPEPSTVLLAAAGVVLLARRRGNA